MRLNEAEKEAPPFSADAQPPAARSTRLAQEPAAEKRSCGRPRPGWVGPRWKTKNDGQPENHNHKRYCALRMSWHPKKSGKKKARGKKTAPKWHFSRSLLFGSRVKKRVPPKRGTGPHRCVNTSPPIPTKSYSGPRASKEDKRNTPTHLRGSEKLVRTYV